MEGSGADDTIAADTLPALGTLPTAAAGSRRVASSTGRLLARGDLVGRYVILSKLGAGGMGIVYAAYDPELDRKLAIKLLLPDGRGPASTAGRTRLLREAQALAKLDHPNVVSIHDVGTFEDRVFLAMEFVDGRTLGQWLETTRTWPEILAVFRAAGTGLAAAHDKGLVHRDFKPDNVMVGDDGRVRVMDFGLARAEAEPERPEHVDDAPVRDPTGAELPRGRNALSTELTAAGSVMGTPAYMAPEQHLGLPTDARTDQFSFCVALWAAVYGEAPFAGDTLAALTFQVTQGRLRTPPKGSRVPKWLRAVCERGLQPQAEQRFASMEQLLAAFDGGQSRQRTRRAAGVVLGLAGLGAAVVGYQAFDERRRIAACEAEGDRVTNVWNEDVRRDLEQGLLATGVSYASVTADKVMPYFDAQAQALGEAHTESCLDARVRGQWDEDTLDRSAWCLQERTMELEALVGELSRADAAVVRKAVKAAAELEPVDPCRNATRLTRRPPPPKDREAVEHAQRLLSGARAMWAAGRYEEGLAQVRAARTEAEAAGWPPLRVAARQLEGSLLDKRAAYPEAEQANVDAYVDAVKMEEWDLAATAAVSLVGIVGEEQARHAEGRLWARHAEAMASLAGDAEGLREATRLNNLAIVAYGAGDYAQAKALHEGALVIKERALGTEHPSVAMTLNNLGLALDALGEHAEARALAERALAIREQTLGREHPDVAMSLGNLAIGHSARGEYAEARALFEQALPIWEHTMGPEHPTVASTYNNLAIGYSATGDLPKAQQMMERALAIWEKSRGSEHPEVAMCLANLGELHVQQGDYPGARALHERAVAIREKALGPSHPDLAVSLGNLAAVDLAQDRPAEAVPLLERAVAIHQGLDGVQLGEAENHFRLARALDESDQDPARALAEARTAAEQYREIGESRAGDLARVQAWITEHGDAP